MRHDKHHAAYVQGAGDGSFRRFDGRLSQATTLVQGFGWGVLAVPQRPAGSRQGDVGGREVGGRVRRYAEAKAGGPPAPS